MRIVAMFTPKRMYSGAIWHESEVLIDRRSKFQGRCCILRNASDVPELLARLVDSNKRLSKASHPHMYAWRTGEVKEEPCEANGKKRSAAQQRARVSVHNISQGSADCGESGAGNVLLSLLEKNQLVNVLVVVTRWYGGTPLGPARFRHISSVAAQSLRTGGLI
ncbi:AaceriACL022Wp [[Ashbya] aceris (nom. inval.)]|nr:AaceriACL022Wp [[Ashbya] aceris (nom. inval.)]